MLKSSSAKKILESNGRISSGLRKLVWALNYLVTKKRVAMRVVVPYTKVNFQICQILLRRGILSDVVVVQGTITIKLRLVNNTKPYTKAVLPKFRIVKPLPWKIPLLSTYQDTPWWKLQPYRCAKFIIVKTLFGLMTVRECVYYRVEGRALLVLY